MVQQANEKHLSDIQLLRNDSTARGLQLTKHDLLANAPERDRSCQAPEVYDGGQIPEVDREQWAPEVIDGFDANRAGGHEINTTKVVHPQTYICGVPRRLFRKLSLCMCGLLVAVVIGVGAGLGLTRHSNSSALRGDNNTLANVPTKAKHGIADNSSLSIITTSEGNKHLFFQEQNGVIRQSFYDTMKGSWVSSSNIIVTSNARNNTPIATTWLFENNENLIYLAYINSQNGINLMCFSSGTWSTYSPPGHGPILESLFGSMFLSLGKTPVSTVLTSTIATDLVLIMESSDSSVCIYRGILGFGNVSRKSVVSWEDITVQLNPSMPVREFKSQFGSPFSTFDYPSNAAGSSSENATNQSTIATFVAKNGTSQLLCEFGAQEISSSIQPFGFINNTAMKSSDIVVSITPAYFMNVMWVNQTSMYSSGPQSDQYLAPPTPCPYSRLATYTSFNATRMFFVYHQLDAEVIAEEEYNWAIGSWQSNNISVQVS